MSESSGRYRKRPVVIEAVHYDGTFPLDFLRDDGEHVQSAGDGQGIEIHTLEGVMRADVGDWIIRGVQGELYPCKPSIFEATYEAVDVNGHDVRLSDDERKRVLLWADVAAGESQLRDGDEELIAKLGGWIDALDRVWVHGEPVPNEQESHAK